MALSNSNIMPVIPLMDELILPSRTVEHSVTIEPEVGRFRNIMRGRIRKDLKRYVTSGELLARQRGKTVSVPMPRLDLPRFVLGGNGQETVGQGEGDIGGQPKSGKGQEGGTGTAEHEQELDVSFEELADILGEELRLPRLEPKGKRSIETEENRYREIRRLGPQNLVHTRRTLRQALLRSIASGEWDPEHPVLPILKEDFRYRSPDRRPKLVTSAHIISVMDVSGSMSDEMKMIARLTSFWSGVWIDRHHKGLDKTYIIHDEEAKEVDYDTFFHTKEAGGTKISSAFALINHLIDTRINPNETNIYVFHYSDGDNQSGDNARAIGLLRDSVLPRINLYGYAQINPQGRGEFYDELREAFSNRKDVALARLSSRDQFIDTIRTFFGGGH